jgi:sugar/nucleoside kinase (ribokinase family)
MGTMEKRILVIGELNIDLIVSGLTAFPSLGQEILAGGLSRVLGSSSAICAAGLARLGAGVDFLGKVGVDEYGEFIVDQLKRLRVSTQHIIRDSVIRTGVTISLTYPEDRALITYPGCIPHLKLDDINLSILRDYAHVHIGSYFLQKRLQPDLAALFVQAHRQNLTVSLDTGCDPDEKWGDSSLLTLLDLVDVFLPNENEARAIAREDDTEVALRKLSERAKLIVIKRGASGAMSFAWRAGEPRREGQIIRSPGVQVDAVDTTGAGDSFDAGFIYAHVVRGMALEEALRFANACGALSTTSLGGTAAQPTLEQVQSLLRQ